MIPTVDILIPTYNRAKFLKEALESIKAQTFKDWRVIVYDDGSTDNTYDIVKAFRDEFPSTLYFSGITNLGVGFARNMLLEAVEADYVMWQDSDDIAAPDRIEKMLQCMLGSGADMCFSQINFFTDGSSPFNLKRVHTVDITRYVDRDGLYNNMAFATGMFKRELTVFKFERSLKRAEDIEWLTRLIEANAKFGFMKKPLYACRRHEGRLTKPRSKK